MTYLSTEHATTLFMAHFRSSFPDSSISVKMHLPEDHIVPWSRLTGAGLGLLGSKERSPFMQGLIPCKERTIVCVTRYNNFSLHMVKEHNLSIAPQNMAAIPPPAKRTKIVIVPLWSNTFAHNFYSVSSILPDQYGKTSILQFVSTFCLRYFPAFSFPTKILVHSASKLNGPSPGSRFRRYSLVSYPAKLIT